MSREEQIHELGLDIENSEVYLNGDSLVKDEEPGVDYRMATTFIKNLNILKLHQKPITIHMNTMGGDWQYGMAIYDAIKHYPYITTIINHSWARSMSSIILQAADKRVMMPHSSFMAHLGTGLYDGHYLTAQASAAWDKRTEDVMYGIYAQRMIKHQTWQNTNIDSIKLSIRDKLRENGDWWLNAEETIYFGLADRIYGK